jgi:hypothetical protein
MLHRAVVPVCAEPVGRSSVSATGIKRLINPVQDAMRVRLRQPGQQNRERKSPDRGH